MTDVHRYNNIVAINFYWLIKIHFKYLVFKFCFTYKWPVN